MGSRAERIETREAPQGRGGRPMERERRRPSYGERRGFEPRAVFQPFRPEYLRQKHGFAQAPWTQTDHTRPDAWAHLPASSLASRLGMPEQFALDRLAFLAPQRINLQPMANQVQRESTFRQISLGLLSFASSIKPFSRGTNVYEIFITRTAGNSWARTQLANIIARLITYLKIVSEQAETIRQLALQEMKQEAANKCLAEKKAEEKKTKVQMEIQRQEKKLVSLQQLRTQIMQKINFLASLEAIKPLLTMLQHISTAIQKILSFLRELARNNPFRIPAEVN